MYCEHSINNCTFWPIFGEDGDLRTSVTENDRFQKKELNLKPRKFKIYTVTRSLLFYIGNG